MLLRDGSQRERLKPILTPMKPIFFYYVSPNLIWDGPTTQNEKSPETARLSLIKNKNYIDSRLDVVIKEQTYQAYNDAQEEAFKPSECILPPHIYSESDGLLLIEGRVRHNKDLFIKKLQEQVRRLSKLREEGTAVDHNEANTKTLSKDEKPYYLWKFSPIGINREAKQAFFYYEHYCGMHCAGGFYVTMELENGSWKVKGQARRWVS